MSVKNVCSIPANWSLQDYSLHNCHDGSHRHITHSELHAFRTKGLVIVLREAKTNREKTVVYVLPHRDVKPGRAHAGGLIVGSAVNTGLSYRVGEQLALAIYHREPWALAMYSQIRMRRDDIASSGEKQ